MKETEKNYVMGRNTDPLNEKGVDLSELGCTINLLQWTKVPNTFIVIL